MSAPLACVALLTLVGLLTLGAACSSSSEGDSTSSGGVPTSCDQDNRKDVYAQGMSKQGTSFTVRVLDATPAPPAKGTNTMTIQIVDLAGAPIDDAVVGVTPFMPDHAHGSAVKPVVTPAGSDGKYAVTSLYYPMAGLWRVTFSVTLPGSSAAQDVAFQFCLDG
ncbi:hypothetical protein AKJ09_09693 [Labilithrix luteola]|uniref:YtkA-like domain-containing protein n=1 Tax=Labilithrix luteola TaxID=1391654 RepID=A0A0K1QC69_9BACT|nr:FixH family protein [Labilithrix luteola]AKV03030.1 hypothetical protein AKJ09_09693 [Labilithrix luteola]